MNEQPLQLSMTQKVVCSLISALLLWMAYTIQSMSTQVAVLQEQGRNSSDLTTRVTTLGQKSAAADERMNGLARRIEALEQRDGK